MRACLNSLQTNAFCEIFFNDEIIALPQLPNWCTGRGKIIFLPSNTAQLEIGFVYVAFSE